MRPSGAFFVSGTLSGHYCVKSGFRPSISRVKHSVLDTFRQRYPEIATLEQRSGMTEQERAAYLARFTEQSSHIGFCVLGGAFITTLGLPAKTPVNEEIMRRMQLRFGRGYDYAYFYIM